MLQAIRNNSQGVFVWIVVGLIVVSFALFGLGSYLSGASKIVAASVNGVEISNTELTRAFQNYQERLRNMLGKQYQPEMFASTRVKKEVLQGLITQELMNQMLQEQGFAASPAQVLAKIKSYKAFQDNGKFSPQRYKEVLIAQRMNGEIFENDLSRDISSRLLTEGIFASAFLTKKETADLSLLQNQKRKISYFSITDKSYRKSSNVNDDEVEAYYKNNTHLYLTEEKIKIEYVELNMHDIAELQEVTDDMVRQQYESSPGNYMSNDVTAAKKKIDVLHKKLKKGADFSLLAKKHSQDKGSAKNGGDLGYLTRGVSEDFDNLVFDLKIGELSQVLKSKQGFQLILLDDIREGEPEERKVRHILIKIANKLKPLSEVKLAIRKELKYQQAGKIFFDDADQMNNLSYDSPESLDSVAEALGLKVKVSSLITRRSGSGIFANNKVMIAAFGDDVLKQGRNSEVLELTDTQFIVLRIKQHQVSSRKGLNSVKSQIINTLRQEKSSIKAQQVTSDILAHVLKNGSISAIQKRYPEVKWVKAGWIKRKAEKGSNSLPARLRQHAFKIPKVLNNITQWDKVTLSAGSHAVIALFDVKEDKTALIDNATIIQAAGDADYNSYLEQLKFQADITISKIIFDEAAEAN